MRLVVGLARIAGVGLLANACSSGRPAAVVVDAGQTTGADAGPPAIVFVSKATFAADFGGIAPADVACQSEASANGLPNASRFVAWLAIGGGDAGLEVLPAQRVQGAGPFAVPSGRVVALDRDALFGAHLALLKSGVDEEADRVPARERRIWTGTTAKGTLQNDCARWSSKGPTTLGSYGLSGHTDATWIFAGDIACRDAKPEYRVYCVESHPD